VLKIEFTARMKKDVRLMIKRGKDERKLLEILALLAAEKKLPQKCKDHQLSGNYAGHRECHIEPDWLLVYRVDKNKLILVATATGTHADLFKQ